MEQRQDRNQCQRTAPSGCCAPPRAATSRTQGGSSWLRQQGIQDSRGKCTASSCPARHVNGAPALKTGDPREGVYGSMVSGRDMPVRDGGGMSMACLKVRKYWHYAISCMLACRGEHVHCA